MKLNTFTSSIIFGALALCLVGTSYAAEISLLNVSYDILFPGYLEIYLKYIPRFVTNNIPLII